MLGQLHDPDLHLLRLFVTVVEAGGFSAAQGVLGLSQPSISQQMGRLETRLGYRLCSRGKGGFRLTEKGELLLKATRELLVQIEQFRQQANGVGGRLLGSVRIGMAENQDASVTLRLANAIARFRQREESVQLELISAPPAELERLLLEQRLDYAISYFSGSQAAFDYQPLFNETQRLYCGQGHPLFAVMQVSAEELLEADQVRHPYRFLKAGEPFQSRRSSALAEQIDSALTFILSGRHIGYLPLHCAAPWETRGLLRALDPGLDFSVLFTLARHRAQAPGEAQQAFAEDLREAFA
ncbi:DNA-binding transcriptional regulator, LysR family [Pseudomonas guariconensis]|uniref:Transcriptional regulator n=1 Tax=Pseudomonas putida TaxID=303 RepID=A0A6S5T7W1_PSEPU|nr:MULTISPECIES: LysR family transcriptional regulator [Pseudomonas]MDM9593422.1 LysR family transcriptional regulator [Pseudomonas guariconensis]MDM9606249.1 LysR family transcriptional regulator [Pseudomonas guariconensis]MDM9611206.1 LysR family transcriptional regulator [Pseudomonas guariconensis]SDD51843.1 DNA-binding transcriptional regulator, LysR family [Pseudomonas guariconensis]BBT39568.1 transcriptional regulator [Pseudomonas putida]